MAVVTDKRRAYNKRYAAEHREAIALKRRDRYQKNKAVALARGREWRSKHPEISKRSYVQNAERLCLERQVQRVYLRNELLSLLGGCCEECNYSDLRVLEIHHRKNDGFDDKYRSTRTNAWYRRWIADTEAKQLLAALCANCHRIHTHESGVGRKRLKYKVLSE